MKEPRDCRFLKPAISSRPTGLILNARQVAIPGAMREIFRCKIFSKFKGTTNYVAKKYRDHVEADDDMYFTDCKMQVILAPASRAF